MQAAIREPSATVRAQSRQRTWLAHGTDGVGAADLGILSMVFSPVARAYAYTHYRYDSTLFVADNLR